MPRYLREAVTIPFHEGVLVDGMARALALRGETATRVLPRLIPLMDGSRSIVELAASLPEFPPEHIRAAVATLFSRGLVEDAAAEPSGDGLCNPESVAFFRRFAPASGVNRSGWEAWQKLLAAEVTLVATTKEAAIGEALRSLMVRTGVPRVRLLTRDSGRTFEEMMQFTGVTLIVSFSLTSEDGDWNATLDDWCRDKRRTWLRCAADSVENALDVGPCFHPDRGPCYRCFQAAQGWPRRDSQASLELCSAAASFWIGMLAVEIVYLINQIGPAFSDSRVRRYEVGTLKSKDLAYPRIPGCGCCRPITGLTTAIPAGYLDTAIMFEDSIALQSKAAITPATSAERSRRGLILSRHTKRAPVCKQYGLNEPVMEPAASVFQTLVAEPGYSAEEFTVDHLATILKLTAGIRNWTAEPDSVDRWSASAGNLGSVELFAAVRNVAGLEPGLYFYQPREHALARILWRTGGMEIDELLKRVLAGSPRELPDAMIFFTGAFHRVSRKYGPFGYKLINLDAGVAMSQLHVAARMLRLHSRTLTCWPDDLLEDQLGLERLEEQSTGAVSLSRWHQEVSKCTWHLPQERGLQSLKPVRDFHGLQNSEIVEMLCRESRIKEGDLGPISLRNGASAHRGNLRDETPAGPLCPRVTIGKSASAVLMERKSIRQFGNEQPSLRQISTLLWHAQHGDVTDWPGEQEEHHALGFMVLASRVAGLESGVYTYGSNSHKLTSLMPVPYPQQMVELMIQDELALAPFQIWVVGNLAAVCARYGAWGHRQFLLRAGSAAHRLWFAAMGLGLAGCIAAGIVSGAARVQLGIDGYERAALVAFVGGFNAEMANT